MIAVTNVSSSVEPIIFSEGQAYTALSRARRLVDVHIAALDWSAFKVDQEAVREYQRLEEVSKSLPELM
jgi:ATP-dependent exoDNAse (exonuclease V) alpha subunit